jgi:O-antigen/teichoic acid export membrane protein
MPSPEHVGVGLGRRFRWSLTSNASGLMASFVGYLLISRFVEPREYGRLSIILATWGLVGCAIEWCGNVMVRFGPIELQKRRSLAVTVSTRLMFAAPVLALYLLALPFYLGHWHGWSTGLVSLTLAYLLAFTAHNVLYWSAIAAQRFGALTGAAILQKGAPLGPVGMALALGRSATAEQLLWATFVGTALAALLLLLALRSVVRLRRPTRTLLARMWRYSLPGLVGLPAGAAIAWLDPLLLQRWASHADVGRQQLAAPTFTLFAKLGSSLNNVIGPELVRARAGGDVATLQRYRDVEQPRLGLVLAWAAFGAALLAEPLVRAVLPPSYALTSRLVAILTVGGGFVLAFSTLQPLVTATDSVWSLQAATMLQAVAGVALTVALAPRWGAVGVALADVGGWAVAHGALMLLLRRLVVARAATLPIMLGSGAVVTAVLAARIAGGLRLAAALVLFAAAAWVGLPLYRRARGAPTKA